MWNARDNAFTAILIQPLEVRPIRGRLEIYLGGADGSSLVEPHLLIEEAANGPKGLPFAE